MQFGARPDHSLLLWQVRWLSGIGKNPGKQDGVMIDGYLNIVLSATVSFVS